MKEVSITCGAGEFACIEKTKNLTIETFAGMNS